MVASAGPQGQKASGFFGSLRDALVAAGQEDTGLKEMGLKETAKVAEGAPGIAPPAAGEKLPAVIAIEPVRKEAATPSAAEAAREARGSSENRHVEMDAPPTTRVVRVMAPREAPSSRTTLVRGKMQVQRGAFDQDPVAGWLVVVGGPGIGQFRPIFEGNNTIGRAETNRIAIDFGDDAISSEEQAYIRYDSLERSFLFVPNLAKTNVVSVNDRRPTGAVELAQMDVITMGRTQLVFVPFCGAEFDWSALQEQAKA